MLQKANKSASLIEYKYLPLNLADNVDYEKRQVSGYLSKFNMVDSDQDIVRKGAYLKSIEDRGPQTTSNRQIKYLLQHNIQTPAGIFTKLAEDSTGLYYDGFIEKTAEGDATLERLRIGFYREHSFGYSYVSGKCEWVKMPYESIPNPMNVPLQVEGGQADVFECKEMNLYEGSIVTFGANSQTNVIDVKSEGDREDKIKSLNELYKWLLKDSPNYSHELMLRANWKKEISLLNTLAVGNTKEISKPNKGVPVPIKGLDWDYINKNLKLQL